MGARRISSTPETYLWIKVAEHLREHRAVCSPKTQRTLLLRPNIQRHEILPVPHVQSVFNQRGRRPGDVA
jgi:hypothetical protein